MKSHLIILATPSTMTNGGDQSGERPAEKHVGNAASSRPSVLRYWGAVRFFHRPRCSAVAAASSRCKALLILTFSNAAERPALGVVKEPWRKHAETRSV